MLGGVLFTFAGASFANVDTGANNLSDEVRTTAHKGSSSPADLSTVSAKTGAFRHATQTFIGTMVAFIELNIRETSFPALTVGSQKPRLTLVLPNVLSRYCLYQSFRHCFIWSISFCCEVTMSWANFLISGCLDLLRASLAIVTAPSW